MTLITHQTNPNDTIIYSKNNCVKCKQTKRIMDTKGIPYLEVNIEESGFMDDYINFLKGDLPTLSMPVVVPADKYGIEPWADFRPQNISLLEG